MNTIIKNKSNREWRKILFEIIFEADTPAGKWFDIVLIISILLSVMTVMLDSVSSIRAKYGEFLYAVEWFFTILFTVEYIFRLLCTQWSTFFGCFVLESQFDTQLVSSASLTYWRYFLRI